jgi:serine/threonine protein phosphatase PrpC
MKSPLAGQVEFYLDGNLLNVTDSHAVVCNVGDSPAYLIQGAEITSLYTADKSLEGSLTQVIGYPESIDIHTTQFDLSPGEVIILATDGVEDVLHPPEIYHFLMRVNAKEIADAIIRGARAKARYDDDKTVIVLRVLES